MPHLLSLTWDEDDRLRSTARSAASAAGDLVRLRQRRAARAQGNRLAGIRPGLQSRTDLPRRASRSTASTPPTARRSRSSARPCTWPTAAPSSRSSRPARPAPTRRQYSSCAISTAIISARRSSNSTTRPASFPTRSTSVSAAPPIRPWRRRPTCPSDIAIRGKSATRRMTSTYHDARYYAPWLGRWTNCDPLGLADGINLYQYARNNPVRFSDPGGQQSLDVPILEGSKVVGGILKQFGKFPGMSDVGKLGDKVLRFRDRTISRTMGAIARTVAGNTSSAATANGKRVVGVAELTEATKPTTLAADVIDAASTGAATFVTNLPGTHAGERAAQFWADLATEGADQGGFSGRAKQVTGWGFGLLASLWTPKTAPATAGILGTTALGAAAGAGRFGQAGLKAVKALAVPGAFLGGVSAGEFATGRSITGEPLSASERAIRGLNALVTALTIWGGARSGLFGRSRLRPPGAGPGIFNKGEVRVGWSWRQAEGEDYFALHGGRPGVTQGPNQHWHLYPNQPQIPSGPGLAPTFANVLVNAFRTVAVAWAGVAGHEAGSEYMSPLTRNK